jgi:hypothetical protein
MRAKEKQIREAAESTADAQILLTGDAGYVGFI